jgi:hypothetical protein
MEDARTSEVGTTLNSLQRPQIVLVYNKRYLETWNYFEANFFLWDVKQHGGRVKNFI